jgi:hypothetical protein
MGAEIVGLKEVGASPPLYGIVGNGTVVPVDIGSCYRAVSSVSGECPGSAVFVSARTFTVDRIRLRDKVLHSGNSAVEVTFPFDLIDFGRVSVEWLAGLSFTRLAATSGVVYSKEIGLFGLAELALAKKIGLPIFNDANMGNRLLSDTRESVQNSMTKLLTESDGLSVLDEILLNKKWYRDFAGLDVDGIISAMEGGAPGAIKDNTFKKLILFYLNNPDNQLDSAQGWVVTRLETVLRKVPNSLIKNFFPRQGHGEMTGFQLDGRLHFGEIWKSGDRLFYFGEDGQIREAINTGSFRYKTTMILDDLPLIIN